MSRSEELRIDRRELYQFEEVFR